MPVSTPLPADPGYYVLRVHWEVLLSLSAPGPAIGNWTRSGTSISAVVGSGSFRGPSGEYLTAKVAKVFPDLFAEVAGN